MNFQSVNGITINGEKVFIEDREVPIPDALKKQLKSGFSSISAINDKVYINGFEYMGDGQWKRTRTALFHKYF